MAQFIPRQYFPTQLNLPRSYFLGHHASGLAGMKTMLSQIDLILECRDYRVPLTSRNPLFEQALAGRERVVVHTKKDLGSWNSQEDQIREDVIREWHRPHSTLFTDHKSKKDIKTVLDFAKDHAIRRQSILPSRILIVGMPNVGKSSLLNSLRMSGMKKSKAASTGAQPGITRKISSAVKILERDAERGIEGVYLVDTPGVFVPYVPDAEAMLKLALVGSVKDTIIAPVTLCDYLLFHINRQPQGDSVYREYCAPTNDIEELLEAVCRKCGKLKKGNVPDIEAAALWIIQKWRQGKLGSFVLDEVIPKGMVSKVEEEVGTSMNQARRQAKLAQMQRSKVRQSSRTY
ncbi:Bgt-1195 [Blumeria graminis f. sp. tritici]|uniref:Bgt-1195 n=2 Tax=Blumeria graminis f. sp. tritici TaxID=62690 RepID=A0A061HJX6_BLUGR|nr:Peripheral GTPase of the mitochondrial inner membrane [Blumeria graminis f. sp. tritici 96224]VDB85941.1 Bgt-1195 [Blumeria graminis f. sp. tritici]